MKFKKLFILSFLLLPCFVAGCTKQSPLTDNTMSLGIQVASDKEIDNLHIGDSCGLTAVIRNSKLEEVDEPVRWSVSQDLGQFTSQTKNTEFVPEHIGSGTITLSCQGMSVSIEVVVVS